MITKERLINLLLPIATIAILVLIWHFGIKIFQVPAYLVPPPGAVLEALQRGLIGGTLWPHIVATVTAIISGYLVGCIMALLLSALISEFDVLERAVYPVIVAFQSIPKVALAPILVVWFGFDLGSKVVMVALICFFPCFVNTSIGLKSYNPELIDLYRAMGASRWQIFWRVKVPSAAGHIFAGLQISVVLALLGTVVAELVASRRGLGHVIAAAGLDFDVAMMFACVVILATIGVLASQLIQLIHRRVVFWESRSAATTVVAH
ncbi:MAG: ABC transporter permease [Xanthobacteraceae bacterium]|nr:ABC transporter permease [Xanthobacteraceae bacterium]